MEWSFVFFLNSVLLGVGLAMDAFSVSMANGLHDPKMTKGTMGKIAGTFGIFQAAMPMIGWVCVHTIVELFSSFESLIPWIALALHPGRRSRGGGAAQRRGAVHAGRGYQHRCPLGGLHHLGVRLDDGAYRCHHHCGGHLLPLHGGSVHR